MPVTRRGIGALALIHSLERADCPISLGAYSAIERGLSIPSDAPRLVAALTSCLRLAEGERADLVKRLIYDILYEQLGALADASFPPVWSWLNR
jgi:hypothetical protein